MTYEIATSTRKGLLVAMESVAMHDLGFVLMGAVILALAVAVIWQQIRLNKLEEKLSARTS